MTTKNFVVKNGITTGNIVLDAATGNITAGNLSMAGTATVGNLTISPGSGNVTGANLVSANFFTGTLTTALQPNITSIGALASLSVSGVSTLGPIANVRVTGGTSGQVISTDGLGNLSFVTNDTNQIKNGNSSVVVAADSDVTVTANGINVITVSGFGGNASNNITTIDGSLTATGNITAPYFIGNVEGTISGNIVIPGPNTGVVFNDAGNASSSNGFTFNKTSNLVTMAGTANVGTLNSAGFVNSANLSVTGNANVGNLGTTALVVTGVSSFGNTVDMNNNGISNLLYPTASADAASKLYVDTMFSTGIAYHQPVEVATIDTLANTTGGTITYNNGSSGVGANLVTTGAFLLIDSANVQTVGTRILVKNEANTVFNGVYTYTSPTVITRATDADEYGTDSTTQLSINDYFFTLGGTVNKGVAFVVSAPSGTITFGTTGIQFAVFSTSQVYTAGVGLTLTGTSFSVNTNQTQVTTVGTLTALSVTGTATAGNLSTTGDITGANVISATTLTATGLATAGNISTVGNITAGNINGGNLVSASFFTGTLANGTSNVRIATANSNVTIATGGSTRLTVTTTGANITGTLSASGAANVGSLITAGAANVGSLITAGTVSATGTATVGNLTISPGSGNVTGANLVSANFFTGTLTTAAQPNITSTGILTSVSVSGTATVGNLSTAGNISGANVISATTFSASGNVTAVNLTVSGLTSLGAVGNVGITGGSSGQVLSTNGSGGLSFITPSSITNGTSNINVLNNGNINMSSAGNANILVVSGTGANVNGTLSATGTATVGNLTISPGSGNITGANLVSANFFTGTLTTALQPNITSTGTLTSVTVSGTSNLGAVGNVTITGGSVGQYLQTNGSGALTWTTANTSIIFNGNSNVSIPIANGNVTTTANGNTTMTVTGTGANITGTLSASGNITTLNATLGNLATANFFAGVLTTAAQPNITSTGTLTSLAVTGTATVGNLSTGGNISATGNIAGNNVTGTLTTANQPNITSTGTLTSLAVTGNVTAGNVLFNGGLQSNRANVSVTTNTVIDEFATTAYSTAKYIISASSANGYQSIEALLVQDGTNSYITIYGSVCSNAVADIIDISSNINGVSGNVSLYATSSGGTATVNLITTYLKT